MKIFKICILIIVFVFSGKVFCQNDSTFSCKCFQNSIFISYDSLATFPGGDVAMIKYINENIKYSQEALNNLIEDKVYARICITKTGKVGNIEIVKGRYDILNQEAYRVISQMPNWNPAHAQGKNTCCSYTIPVNFKIDRVTKRKIRRQKRN
jgi:hypothetical protein